MTDTKDAERYIARAMEALATALIGIQNVREMPGEDQDDTINKVRCSIGVLTQLDTVISAAQAAKGELKKITGELSNKQLG